MDLESFWFALALGAVAALYAAVGQAGATGYLALMGVAGFDPAVMKPTALALNVVVASIATAQFASAGLFSWRSTWPFCAFGVPFSFLGGAVHLPAGIYYPVVGGLLLAASAQLFYSARRGGASGRRREPATPPLGPALVAGAAVGFVAGATGAGGGVLLAPLVLALNWIDVRRAAATTAVFNLVNSAAALAGSYATVGGLPSATPAWMAVVAMGGLIGARIGARRLPERALRAILGVLLAASGAKMLFN